ncbi:MAG: response regulator [Vicinamibacteria bacterium]
MADAPPAAETLPIRVLLADDHRVVRQAIRLMLEREGLQVVAEASDGLQAVRLARELQPDVAVLDLLMPGLNGLDAAHELRQASPATQLVLLTTQTGERHLLQALKAGFKGCVFKSHQAQDLLRAIREVAAGGTYLHPEMSEAVVGAYLGSAESPKEPLSSRERQVLQLIAEGKGTKQVAVALGVSVKTVESHRSRLMKKLDIRETAGLVRYAIRQGLSEL